MALEQDLTAYRLRHSHETEDRGQECKGCVSGNHRAFLNLKVHTSDTLRYQGHTL